jgi:transcriptional regulator with XRE-family HTH domain
MPEDRNTLKAFGMRLKQLREAADLTQRQVADELEVEEQTPAQWEAGRFWIRYELLVGMAELLEVDCLDFFVTPGSSVRHDLIELTRRISPAQLRLLKATAQQMEQERARAMSEPKAQYRSDKRK